MADVSQVTQPVRRGLDWTLVLFTLCQVQSGRPASGSKKWLGSSCWPTIGVSGLRGPGGGVRQACQVFWSNGLASTGLSSLQITIAETQPRSVRYGQ